MHIEQVRGPRISARFQFDGRLDPFLAREHRDCEFDWSCPARANLKHMVEALGIPHTEVGLVLVNGRATELSQAVCEGDRIQVLPALPMEVDAQSLCFAADSHLGGLARLLRMAGFDTLFDNAWPDEELARLSAHEARIVLSRDRDLLKRRDIVRGCHILNLHPQQQLKELADRYPLAQRCNAFSRCLPCNVELELPEPELLRQSVPPAVLQRHQHFMRCPACRRIYWEGSHWTRMRGRLAELLPRPGEELKSGAV